MSDQPARSSAPWQLILMLIIVISTILAGFLVFPTTQEERSRLLSELGTTNKGTLLQPVASLNALTLVDGEGLPWDWKAQKAKWRLLVPATNNCDQPCRDMLYTTRQVHVRLAKYATRVERVFVDLGGDHGETVRAFLNEEHPHLRYLAADRTQFKQWLVRTNLPDDPALVPAILVDPAGVAMMFYTPRQSGNEMLEDLNHLLKYSKE